MAEVNNEFEEEYTDKKEGQGLAIAALVFYILTIFSLVSFLFITYTVSDNQMSDLIIKLCPIFAIASIILIIITRIKYPKNRMGLVVMIVALISYMVIIGIIILALVACYYFCTSCINSLGLVVVVVG